MPELSIRTVIVVLPTGPPTDWSHLDATLTAHGRPSCVSHATYPGRHRGLPRLRHAELTGIPGRERTDHP